MSRSGLRPFWTFLGASAALHLALVAELPGVPLRIDGPPAPLSAELVALAPAPPPQPAQAPPKLAAPEKKTPTAPSKPAPAAPKPAQPAAKVTKPPAPPPSAPPRVEPAVPAASIPAAEVKDVPSEPQHEYVDPPATAVSEPESAAPSEPGAEASGRQAAAADALAAAPPQPGSPQAAPVPEATRPQTGTLQFEVFYGSDRFSIGRSVQTWSIDQDSYRLTSFSETTGLLALFKPYQYSYVAEGRVRPDGLRPEAFTVRRGRDGEKQASARFDWANEELTFGKLGSPRKARLDANSYDLLTLFYELPRLALTPGRIEVSVTTGTKFRTYRLEVLPEELIELPIGTVRAIPVRQVREPGEESIAVWLAPEQRNLPVRICFYDEDGAMAVEQVATRISFGALAADVR